MSREPVADAGGDEGAAPAGGAEPDRLVEPRLRLARRFDLERIVAIEQRCFSDPWSFNSFDALLGNPRTFFCVAEAASAVLGYVVAWFAADEAEIANLAVSSELRRAGVGARLLDAALAEARRRGSRVAYLEVRDSNTAARALYRSRNFEEINRRPRYYRKPVEDALVLRTRL